MSKKAKSCVTLLHPVPVGRMVTYKQFVTRIAQLLDNNLDNNLYNNLGNILDNSLVLGPWQWSLPPDPREGGEFTGISV